jgi:hypothetical protein
MSFEQLLLLVVLVLLPLLQGIAERRRDTNATRSPETLPDDDELGPEPASGLLQPPQAEPPSSHRVAPRPARLPRTERPRRAMAQPARHVPRRMSSAGRSRLREAVPRDRENLRRAMLLVEILGPPRALDKKR